MLYVGMDVHLRSTTLCIVKEDGKRVKALKVSGPVSRAVEELKRLGKPFEVCFEASCGYGRLYDQLRKLARRVVVGHPGHLRLIFRSKQKNDRRDAEMLAMLLRLDRVPAVHVPASDMREWRSAIEFRQKLLRRRTQVKNQIRALLRSYGISAPSGHRLWTQRGLAWLGNLELPGTMAAMRRDIMLDELRRYNAQMKRVEKQLNEWAEADAGVALLRTIPGVGIRTAETIRAYIDDPKRFRKNKAIGSYFGLVPSLDHSGNCKRQGRITREGPATGRLMLTEAAWQGIRHSPHIRAYFERIQRGDPLRKKKALVATAHYLARVMLAMLCTGECWRYDQELDQAA